MTASWRHQQFDSVTELVTAYRRGVRPRLHFTKHAAQRFAEMRITEDELFRAISRPQRIHLSKRYNALNLSAGRITVAVDLDTGGYPNVTTILWWTDEDWKRADKDGHIGNGRVLKPGIPNSMKATRR